METAKLEEMAKKVEALEGPDREVDAEIARTVLKHTASNPIWQNGTPLLFTTSLDAAMMLVPEGWAIELQQLFDDDGEHWCRVTLANSFGDELPPLDAPLLGMARSKGSKSPAIALTAAALRARAQQEKSNEHSDRNNE